MQSTASWPKEIPSLDHRSLFFLSPVFYLSFRQTEKRRPHLITVVTTSAIPAWLVGLGESKSMSKNSVRFLCTGLRSSAEATRHYRWWDWMYLVDINHGVVTLQRPCGKVSMQEVQVFHAVSCITTFCLVLSLILVYYFLISSYTIGFQKTLACHLSLKQGAE